MSSLFVKEEQISASPVIVGYRILQHLEQRDKTRVSVFDIASAFKDCDWYTPKNLYFGMMFLHAIGVIRFEPPYIERHV